MERLPETVEIRGTVIRLKGKGLRIKPAPKSEAGFRTLAIPTWYAHQLRARKPADAQPGDPVFCSVTSGKLRDPSNTPDQLRDAFDDAGYPWVTSHVYRKTVVTQGAAVMEQIAPSPHHGSTDAQSRNLRRHRAPPPVP